MPEPGERNPGAGRTDAGAQTGATVATGAARKGAGAGAFAGEEQRNVRNLVLLVSGLVAWPALSAGLVMLLFDREEHFLHIALFLPLGLAALLVFFNAGKVARRFVAAE